MRRLLPPMWLLALGIAGALPTPASAASYNPPALVSDVGSSQAENAYSPAISADGRYVAFTGVFNGISGVYRKDLGSGELELVAGAETAEPALNAPDAGSPSISADGRYVSFTSSAVLTPAASVSPGCSNVYVRDMTIPAQDPGAYTLASALNGTEQGIGYASCPNGVGSAAADRVALSGDGRQVAFTVVGESNLTGGPGAPTSTPPDQVAVRDLDTETTMLVSQTMASLSSTPQPVPGGAALTMTRNGLQSSDGRELSASTASISADGSTVAWMGIDIPQQAPAAAESGPEGDGPGTYSDEYAEPLWRRIADGPAAPTRRITGGDDPLGCPSGCAGPLDTEIDPNIGGATGLGPAYGTYVAIGGFSGDPAASGSSLDAVTPQLSANGQIVALLSTQPDTGHDPSNPQGSTSALTANAFVVNMAPGLSRDQALTRLTEWGDNVFSNPSTTGPIEGIAISADGTRVALTTQRVVFPLSPPALVTPTPTLVPSNPLLGGAADSQLYVANLTAGTLSLASYGFEGQVANQRVDAASFADDHTLVFASGATNLVYGAYNSAGSNVFTTSEISSEPLNTVSVLGAAPANPVASPAWELLTTTRRGADGTVALYVTVPGAGTVKATAAAAVDVRVESKARGAKARVRTVVRTRTVADAKSVMGSAGMVGLRLKVASAYRSRVAAPKGVFSTVTVRFTARGHASLSNTVQVRFQGKPAKPKQAVKPKKAAKPKQAAKLKQAVKPAGKRR